MRRSIIVTVLCSTVILVLLTQAGTILATEQQVLKFGIVPQQSATKLAKQWTPLIRYLSEKSRVQILFKTAPNIPTFEERVAQGEYDIAYMNPYHYTVFHEQPGYEAIAKQKDKKVQGIIVVARDSSLQDISELDSMSLAFPAPAAFAASVLPRAALHSRNIAITPVYVNSHDSVYLTVAKGIYPAGGGIVRTFNAMPSEIKEKLRILWKTEMYTPHAIAVHPRVSADVRTIIQQALIELGDDPAGADLLAGINFKGIEQAENRDWDDVRALGIDLLTNLKEEN